MTGLYRYPVQASDGRRFELSTVVAPAECQALLSRFQPLQQGGHAHVVFHTPGWYKGGPGGPWVDFYRLRRLQEPRAAVHIGYTMFETDRIDPNWAAACNGMDEIWVPTDFNRQTFAASGVDPDKLHVVPLGLDVERYRPDRVRPLQLAGRSAFNFLAVFEWNKRKGYDVLLRAYAAEFTSDDDVTLFVRTYGYASAGRHAPGEQQLREYFLSLCPDPGRAPKLVFLLDKIPDEHMPALYAACDAFVLPTRGEGWGLPFMEAMAMAKPTIGTRWSAHTAFMTEENSFLIDTEGLVEIREGDPEYPPEYWGHRMAQPSGDHLRQLMRYVLAHPNEARRRGERARQDVATRWTRANATRQMLDRLNALRERSEAQATRPAGAEVVWTAPLLDPSGYADEARNFVTSLDRIGVPLRAAPLRWSNRLAEIDAQELEALERLVEAPLAKDYVNVQHTFPVAFQRDPHARATVGRTMFETDRIPDAWVERCNAMDQVWVPSDFNLATFAAAGVDPSRLRKLPAAIDARKFRVLRQPLPLGEQAHGFKFLSVFDWSLRKGWDVLLRAYLEEFAPDEDVCLVLKTHSSRGASDADLLDRLRAAVVDIRGPEQRVPRISLLGGTLSNEQLLRLYHAVDAYVMPSRGEGWGRPYMEAMATGLPTIGTNWSGNTEFMHADNAYLLDYELVDVSAEAVAEVGYFAGHRWAEPSVPHLRSLMREVFTDPDAARLKGARARAEILERFDQPVVARIAADHLEELLGRPATRVPVAWEGPPTRSNPPDPFRPGLAPFPLNGTRGLTFLHHPRWASTAWRDVVCSYARAFGADDPVTLVLWLDPSQGLSEAEAVERVTTALRESGLDPERTPDLLLVPDQLDVHGLASLYAAVDWVVPHGDAEPLQRALKCDRQVLTRLEAQAWRAAADSRLDASLAA